MFQLRIAITSKLYASLSVNGGYSVTNTPNGTTYSPTDLILPVESL